MAERRMFSKQIIDSDAFLDMPLSAQALYFHLSMRADDDGFINNPKKIQRMVGATDDDCKLLIAKKFVLTFESGVIVIKHWRLHNYIRKDRYKETVYLEEKSQLSSKENGIYFLGIPTVDRTGDKWDTQVSIDKVSIDKVSVVEGSSAVGIPDGIPNDTTIHTDTNTNQKEINPLSILQPLRHDNVFLSEDQITYLLETIKMDLYVFDDYIDKLSAWKRNKNATVKSDFQTILKWYTEDSIASPLKGGV